MDDPERCRKNRSSEGASFRTKLEWVWSLSITWWSGGLSPFCRCWPTLAAHGESPGIPPRDSVESPVAICGGSRTRTRPSGPSPHGRSSQLRKPGKGHPAVLSYKGQASTSLEAMAMALAADEVGETVRWRKEAGGVATKPFHPAAASRTRSRSCSKRTPSWKRFQVALDPKSPPKD